MRHRHWLDTHTHTIFVYWSISMFHIYRQTNFYWRFTHFFCLLLLEDYNCHHWLFIVWNKIVAVVVSIDSMKNIDWMNRDFVCFFLYTKLVFYFLIFCFVFFYCCCCLFVYFPRFDCFRKKNCSFPRINLIFIVLFFRFLPSDYILSPSSFEHK